MTSRDTEGASTVRRAWGRAPVAMFGATVAGIGHLPGGPGTYAAAVAVPTIVGMSGWSFGWRVACLLVVVAAAIGWSGRAGAALGEPDSRRIVVDEWVGVWTALVGFDDLGWAAAAVGFVVFRILDILKPPGAGWLHRRADAGGWTVVGDDLLAGLWTVPAVWGVRVAFGW